MRRVVFGGAQDSNQLPLGEKRSVRGLKCQLAATSLRFRNLRKTDAPQGNRERLARYQVSAGKVDTLPGGALQSPRGICLQERSCSSED